MIALLKFLTYILAAYGLAALLVAPLVVALNSTLPLDQVIQRGGMILALLGLWPFLNWYGLANRAALGYGVPNPQLLRSIILGFCIGIIILTCLVIMLLWFGSRVPTGGIGLGRLPRAIAEGVITGLLVAVLEETFFRGAVFTAICHQQQSPVVAIWGSSLLYATLHFLRPQPLPPNLPPSITSVFDSLAGSVPALLQLQNLDAMLSLLLVGVFLALLRHRTGHLGWGLGIHAGLIAVIKVSHTYTDVAYSSPWVVLVGHYDGITGWLAAAWIGMLALAIACWPLLPKADAADIAK